MHPFFRPKCCALVPGQNLQCASACRPLGCARLAARCAAHQEPKGLAVTVTLCLGIRCKAPAKSRRCVGRGSVAPEMGSVADCQPEAIDNVAQAAEDAVPKRNCPNCLRPQRVCLCEALPEVVETDTQVVLFTHPKELKRSLCTGPLLELCLKRIIKFVGKLFPEPEDHPALHEQLCQGGRQCFLLYPGPEASDVAEIASKSPVTLILIDARWRQARIMLNRSTWLQALPRVSLPHKQSGYIWRQQPAPGCVSTLEAVSEALNFLEGNDGAHIKSLLLRPFEKMVQLQCQFTPNAKDKNANLGLPTSVEKENANPLWNRSRRRKRRRNTQSFDFA